MTEDQIIQEIKEIKRLIGAHRFKKGLYKLGALLEEVDRLDETDTDDADLMNEFIVLQTRHEKYSKDKMKGVPRTDEDFNEITYSIILFLDNVKKIAIEYAKDSTGKKQAQNFAAIPDETIATNVQTNIPSNTSPDKENQPGCLVPFFGNRVQLSNSVAIASILTLGLVVFGGMWFFSDGWGNEEITTTTTTTTTPSGTTTTTTTTTITKPAVKNGLDGKELGFVEASPEDKIADFLSYSNPDTPSKEFNIDANFSRNSSRLNSAVFPQLDNIADILEKYPKARIDIYGYIGKNESGSGNKEVSLDDDRARAVYNYLKKKKIDESRMNFQGDGESDENERINILIYPEN